MRKTSCKFAISGNVALNIYLPIKTQRQGFESLIHSLFFIFYVRHPMVHSSECGQRKFSAV
jgi:hypothetical protein